MKGPRAKGPEGLSPTPLATALPASKNYQINSCQRFTHKR